MFAAGKTKGASAAAAANYIEDVFSTYLYTGNGSSQTITNGIDLSTYGGLTWIKKRNAAEDHILTDTVRGAGNTLFSNLTSANEYDITRLSAFTSSGFSVGTSFRVNQSSNTYASWTFRKQPKFFDVVTYTGNYTARTIAHSLGSVPGCIIVKKTSSADDWRVYHRSLATNQYMTLETTAAVGTSATMWNNTAPTSTVFSIGAEGSVNDPGETFVAYLFAHNAGGFGLTGTDNVISCGSYTGNGSEPAGPIVTLGYEPQWLLIKKAGDSGYNRGWYMFDNMRGMPTGSEDAVLQAQSANAESTADGNLVDLTATGFQIKRLAPSVNESGIQYIYIAIRRGPMKTPTSGTSVFAVNYGNNIAAAGTIINSSMRVDAFIQKGYASGTPGYVQDRLRGAPQYVQTSATDAELSANDWRLDQNTGVGYAVARDLTTRIGWMFQRAPGFFDEVCYTGTGSATTQAHNLGVAPELMIVKQRSGANYWPVYSAAIGNDYILSLDTTGAKDGPGAPQWNNTAPTASVFSLGASSGANASGGTYVAYLFASCPGVSKVGSYSGTGATQTISCGFAARFVLIKRTDSTGDWWVWDTTRGMISGTDPRLAFNNNNAQTDANWVYTNASGFQIVTTDATVNASGGSYIFLAVS